MKRMNDMDGHEAQKRARPSGLPVEIQVLFPSNLVNQIIGKGGAAIKQLEDTSGCRISIDNHNQTIRDEEVRVVTINATSIDQTLIVQRSFLETELSQGGAAAGSGGKGTNRMLIPNQFVSLLIGKRGDYIREVTMGTNAWVSFVKDFEMPRTMQHVRLLTIKGNTDECVNAASMMWSKYMEYAGREPEQSNRGPEPKPHPTMIGHVSESQHRELMQGMRPLKTTLSPGAYSAMQGPTVAGLGAPMGTPATDHGWEIVEMQRRLGQGMNEMHLNQGRRIEDVGNGYNFVGEQAREKERRAPETKVTVWVPNGKVGQLIGTRGAGIKNIIEKSKGAFISVAKEDETQFLSIGDKGPCALRPITIKGRTSQAFAAAEIIQLQLMETCDESLEFNMVCLAQDQSKPNVTEQQQQHFQGGGW